MEIVELLESFSSNTYVQATLLTIVTAITGRLLVAKPILRWGVSHVYNYAIPGREEKDPTLFVRTGQIWLTNWGRIPATKVVILLDFTPQHIEVWPPRPITRETSESGRLSISIPDVAPKEIVTVSMLDTFGDLPQVLDVRSDTGLGRAIVMGPQIVFPRWANAVAWLLVLTGFFAISYQILGFIA